MLQVKPGRERTTSRMSMCCQSLQDNGVMRHLRDGLQEKVLDTESNDMGGASIQLKAWSNADDLTAPDCVLWLSEYRYVGPTEIQPRWRTVASRRRLYLMLAESAAAAGEGARSLAATEVVRIWVGRLHPREWTGEHTSQPVMGTPAPGPTEGTAQSSILVHPHPHVLPAPWHSYRKQQKPRAAEQNDAGSGNPESNVTNGVLAGDDAVSPNVVLEAQF